MLSRREWLSALAVGTAASRGAGVAPPAPPSRFGVVLYSYSLRASAERERGFADPLRFLAFCRERGADGVQLPLGARDSRYVRALRQAQERLGMYLEGSVRPPRDRADVDRFEAEVRTAREAGVAIMRTVLLGGRRYETFSCRAAYDAFRLRAWHSLQLALPVLEHHRVRLAVENHKDLRTGELVDLMRKLASDLVGVCVDLGNNLALLDDPLSTVRALAPWTLTCHLKDMAVADYAGGFLLAEVPLGEGILDLPRMVALLRKARPDIRFGLEMITRDPLKVPCLEEKYWATMSDVSGRDLARTLALVRRRSVKAPLPRISALGREEQIAQEESNVRRSLAYARRHLAGT
jgi:sugar phosphate isomerase/epimerase